MQRGYRRYNSGVNYYREPSRGSNQMSGNNEEPVKKKMKTSTIIIIVVVILILLIAIGLALWFFVFRKKSTSSGGGGGTPTTPLTNFPSVQIGSALLPSPNGGAGAGENVGHKVSMSGSGTQSLVGMMNPLVQGFYSIRKTGGLWGQSPAATKYLPSDNGTATTFTWSMTVNNAGTVMAAGALDGTFPGSFWIYDNTAGSWVQNGLRKFPSVFPVVAGGDFGWDLDLDGTGTVLAVSATQDESNAFCLGAIWIWRNSAGWTESQKIIPPSTVNSNIAFGRSLALSRSGKVLVSADCVAGILTLRTYVDSTGTFVFTDTISTGAPIASDSFQVISLAINAAGTVIAVGVQEDDAGVGSVRVYRKTGINWNFDTKLVPNGNIGACAMGNSIAITDDGNVVVAGAWLDNAQVGACFVYRKETSGWVFKKKLTPSDATGLPRFGSSIDLDSTGSNLIVGGNTNSSEGAVWFFSSA